MPAVTALMVFHRLPPFFPLAVRSLLEQSLADLELVLVNNGCDPAAAAAALGGAADDRRIRWVHRPENDGIAAGFNAGLAEVRGEFVLLLDYDDLALPDRAARQVEALRADPRLGFVSSQVEMIDAAGAFVRRGFAVLRPAEQQAYLRFAPPAVNPTLCGRTAAFRQFPYRDTFKCCMDYDQMTRIGEVWGSAAVPAVLTRYREHGEQTTVRRKHEMQLEACAIRLLTARRRAGRAEGFAEVAAGLEAWRGREPGEFFRDFAVWCDREALGEQAVYHARKWFAARRDPAALAGALRVLARALRREPSRAGFLLHLFTRGPVRALRLHPNPPG